MASVKGPVAVVGANGREAIAVSIADHGDRKLGPDIVDRQGRDPLGHRCMVADGCPQGLQDDLMLPKPGSLTLDKLPQGVVPCEVAVAGIVDHRFPGEQLENGVRLAARHDRKERSRRIDRDACHRSAGSGLSPDAMAASGVGCPNSTLRHP
jgi:hypothetical protein